jgi:bifunctional UDP-N-acetylglucosamine pyrophosphorylase/glucosamine-1-phosphate N-acetyltransferase
MRSQQSKVLHSLAGRPLLHYPVLAAARAGAGQIIVVASPGNLEGVTRCLGELADIDTTIVVQQEPRGTGDAVRAALDVLASSHVLILYGDVPLLEAQDVEPLIQLFASGASDSPLALLTCELDDATGYGRILRDGDGAVIGVREQRDLASDQERAIREVNSGIYMATKDFLKRAVPALKNDNSQGELYLTDIVEEASRTAIVTAVYGSALVLQGVNDRRQLASLESVLYERIADRHRLLGATIQAGVWIDDTVEIGNDATIKAGVALRGKTSIGARAFVDHGCIIEDSTIAEDVIVKPHTVISDSRVGARAQLGPSAHLRPQSELDCDVRVGNFVETKKTRMRAGSKANHLAYLGDADIGERANVGAGTIVCNYDGFSKARTVIGKEAFIGSDSQLIAPITIGDGAYVATGTTLTEDVPAQSLALSRSVQVTKPGYAVGLRERLRAKAGK